MTSFTNDSQADDIERPPETFSVREVLIPGFVFVAALVVLWIAFQKAPPKSEHSSKRLLKSLSTEELLQQPRTTTSARELLSRKDVSFEILEACVQRLSVQEKTAPAEICLQVIRNLDENVSVQLQKDWLKVLQPHVSAGTLQAVQSVADQKVGPGASICLAALFSWDRASVSPAFRQSSGTYQQFTSLLKAVRLVQEPEVGALCLEQVNKVIFEPAVRHSGSVDIRTVLAAIETVSVLPVQQQQKANLLADIVIHKICRGACIERLNQLPTHCFQQRWAGNFAAAVLDYLAIQKKSLGKVADETAVKFAQRLASVFRGEKRQRYQSRLQEIVESNFGEANPITGQ